MATLGTLADDTLDFTSGGTSQVLMTAAANTLTYTGTTASTDEVVVTGVTNAATYVAVDSANKEFVLTSQYDAVVDAGGNGTHTLLSAAVTAGATSIYIKSGTYDESGITANISCDDGTYIVGENKFETIIDFGTTDFGLELTPSGTVTTTIATTFTATNGSANVTTTGATFTASFVGGYFLLEDTFYEISAVNGANDIDLVNAYNGNTITGGTSIGITLMASGTFKNFTLQSSGSGTGDLLFLGSVNSCLIKDMCFIDARRHAIAGSTAAGNVLIDSCIIENSNTDGINFLLTAAVVVQSNITNSVIKNCGGDGISLDLVRNIIIDSLNISDCGGDGISINSGFAEFPNEISISNTVSDRNDGNGLSTVTGTGVDGVIIQGCNFTDNGADGIALASSSNIVKGCVIDENDGDGISLAATSDSNTITGNQITNNGAYGIAFTSGNTDNIVSSNVIEGNTTDQIDNPDGTTTANIMFTGNMVAGVKDNAILYGYDATGGTAIAASPGGGLGNPVVFDTSSIAQVGLSLNTGTGVVTITEAGIYEVSYWVQCESLNTSGVPRTELTAQIETDPLGGVAWALIAGSACSAYIREQAAGIVGYGCGKTVPISAAAGETLRITFFKGAQTTTAQTKADESSIYIKRLGS